MAEHDAVRQLLQRVADELGTIELPPMDELTARRKRGEFSRRVLAVAAAVVVVAGVAVGVSLRPTGSSRTTAHTPNPAVSPATTGPSVAAAAFGTYRWHALPAAPIPVRTGAAAVWTGTDLFVWGGAIGNKARADGALYDPATRHWTVLPPSPLPAAAYAQAVVVDGSVLVRAGTHAAAFDLRSRTWSELPPAPPGPSSQARAQLVALGNVAVLVRATTDGKSRTAQADTYDVHGHRWFRGAQVRTPSHHGIGDVTALGVGSVVDVWLGWEHTVSTGPGSTESTSGVDAYRFDPQAGSWKAIAARPDQGRSPSGAMWTGSRILFPQSQYYCGPCSPPPLAQATPRLVDPNSGKSTTIPNGPLGAAADDLFWTGGSLLAYDSRAERGPIRAGDLAVWSASTGWTRLPRSPAPSDTAPDVVVWTGSALLVWGIGDAHGVRSGTGGVEFSAP